MLVFPKTFNAREKERERERWGEKERGELWSLDMHCVLPVMPLQKTYTFKINFKEINSLKKCVSIRFNLHFKLYSTNELPPPPSLV